MRLLLKKNSYGAYLTASTFSSFGKVGGERFILSGPPNFIGQTSSKRTLYGSILMIGCAGFLYIQQQRDHFSNCWSPFKVSHAFSIFSGKKETDSNSKYENGMTKALTLRSAMEYSDKKDRDAKQAYENLKRFEKEGESNFEYCWRMARASIEYASKVDIDSSLTRSLYESAEIYAKKALEINHWSSVAHLWMGIALSHTNSYESFFKRISKAPIIKAHFERAMEFNSTDPFTHHMLAMWHYTVADYSFFAKLLTLAIFGGGSTLTSFHEALMKFEDAERIQPNFSVKNHLMLGKTNVRLDNHEAAKKWLNHCLKMPTVTKEDSQVKEEAVFIMNYLEELTQKSKGFNWF